MQGLMMDVPLTITSIIQHAESVNGHKEIVSVTRDNPRHRYTYKDAFCRSRQLANVIDGWGLSQGDRIATLAWNDYRHLEAYYAAACSGYVCHTINPRLFPEQIVYIINHADDQFIFVDPDFWPLIEQVAGECSNVKGWVVMATPENMPDTELANVYCYESLLEGQPDQFSWPELDENAACALCYTSGTTGNPKGVLYSHRSTVLHTYATLMPDALGMSGGDVVMPIVPMFHVNAWGNPYACPVAGCKMVMPGNKMGDGATLAALINEEGVTMSAGVPTVWLNLLNHLRSENLRVDTLKQIVVGGSACPLSIMEEFDTYGVDTRHAWGMTEMSPLGTTNVPTLEMQDMSKEEKYAIQLKQGKPIYGVELKVVDDTGKDLPHDGESQGHLLVRGPWILQKYFKAENDAVDKNGWFDTGDISVLDQDGYMTIKDRAKDVIKSGGEWISSIDLENAAFGHPEVAEACVVGIPHPKWDERPMLFIVSNTGQEIDKQSILDFLASKVAKWWLPDEIIFLKELPHGATGKLQKFELRDEYTNYYMENKNA